MRILPVINNCTNKNRMNARQTNFERKDSVATGRAHHKYTGVASVDLAYASMFDSTIARDLKLMGLI